MLRLGSFGSCGREMEGRVMHTGVARNAFSQIEVMRIHPEGGCERERSRF
jgi:hypothetical protein